MRRGFTLLEVLLALALVAMLATGVMGFLWGLLDRRDSISKTLLDSHAGAALLERMEADILCGLAGGPGPKAGIAGTATSLKLLTRGVAIPLDAAAARGPAAGDLQGSEYIFDQASGMIRARRWAGGSTGSGEFETLSDHVQALRLSYFDGDVWRGSFDSGAEGGLPIAIEVALWFGEPLPEEEDWGAASEPVEEDRGGPEGAGAEPVRAASRGASAPPQRTPDRLRVIVVPDGPVSAWKETR